MTGVKLFRKADLDLEPTEGKAVLGLVNTGFSAMLGAGIGVFEDCAVDWTVTYDEVLFVLAGTLTVRVEGRAYRGGPGDVLWIPRDTPLTYEAEERVTFFYATCPAANSPSTGLARAYPTTAPE